tara:strand:- start:318 stop:500 length:183 start_codon:yes stop_codon:yes gene_type:complete
MTLLSRFSKRGQDRYRDRRTDTPNDNLQLENGTYILLEAGDNIKLEQAVGTVFSGRPIPS